MGLKDGAGPIPAQNFQQLSVFESAVESHGIQKDVQPSSSVLTLMITVVKTWNTDKT